MKTERHFLIARSLARLIQKERGVIGRAVEGYFSSDAERVHFLSIDSEGCQLVLRATAGSGEASEERTDVSRAQAESLLNVCVGKVAYDRSRLPLGGNREAVLDRFAAPSAFDLVTVEFETASEAGSFYPPAWFGPEVTGDAAYGKRALALGGAAPGREVALSNAALESLLDVLENRFSLGRYGQTSTRLRADQRPSESVRPTETARSNAAAPIERPVSLRVREPVPAPIDTAPVEPDPAPVAAVVSHELSYGEEPAEDHAAAPADDEAGRFDDVIATLSRALVDPAFLGGDAAAPARPVDVELERTARRVRREER